YRKLIGNPLKPFSRLFLFRIPISVFMKVFEAKERAGRYLRECLFYWFRVPGSSADAGRGSEGRRGGGQGMALL
ncbi:MAG: hypothetical protein O7G29_09730, partial [Acidobacteria bacterium]|nr:hypothetical protein [Acidobacteriota bacterium]